MPGSQEASKNHTSGGLPRCVNQWDLVRVVWKMGIACGVESQVCPASFESLAAEHFLCPNHHHDLTAKHARFSTLAYLQMIFSFPMAVMALGKICQDRCLFAETSIHEEVAIPIHGEIKLPLPIEKLTLTLTN